MLPPCGTTIYSQPSTPSFSGNVKSTVLLVILFTERLNGDSQSDH